MRPSRQTLTAMLGAAAVAAQGVAGKATRDALFLSSLDVTALPAVLVATSLGSILALGGHARLSRRFTPGRLVPLLFAGSAILFAAEWLLLASVPSTAAVVVYLHVSIWGALLGSGFWLIASEQFDPATAKRRFGQIAGAGTLGGLAGGLLAERVAVGTGASAMLLYLAAFQAATAVVVRRLAMPAPAEALSPPADVSGGSMPRRSGLRILADAPHLQHLAALVVLGTTSAALLEYLFKAQAVQRFGPGDGLLRFFALYYAAISLVTFVLQTAASRAMLERFGVGLTSSTPSIALLAGGLVGLVVPGFGGLVVARAGEAIFRGSWFRAGYELFYTPIPPVDKRAAKSVVDVGFDRLGDAVGGGLVKAAVWLAPAVHGSLILLLAMLGSVGAIMAASRLNRWYLQTLELSLVRRAGGLEQFATVDLSMRKLVSAVRRDRGRAHLRLVDSRASTRLSDAAAQRPATGDRLDPDVEDILALRSGNRSRIVEILTRQRGLSGALVPHVIPLLAVEPLADHASFALWKVAEERVGQLADALLEPGQTLAVRLRLVRVFAVCVSQRAADVVQLALDDREFALRFQAARSLVAMRQKNPRLHIDRDRVASVVRRELAVDRASWQGRQSLSYVFTLLSLILGGEPVRVAFRSLQSADDQLRGTALEYLERVLPPGLRDDLWPFLLAPHEHPTRLRAVGDAALLQAATPAPLAGSR